jgi:DNA-binding CsgD family transcriptional regulator
MTRSSQDLTPQESAAAACILDDLTPSESATAIGVTAFDVLMLHSSLMEAIGAKTMAGLGGRLQEIAWLDQIDG